MSNAAMWDGWIFVGSIQSDDPTKRLRFVLRAGVNRPRTRDEYEQVDTVAAAMTPPGNRNWVQSTMRRGSEAVARYARAGMTSATDADMENIVEMLVASVGMSDIGRIAHHADDGVGMDL